MPPSSPRSSSNHAPVGRSFSNASSTRVGSYGAFVDGGDGAGAPVGGVDIGGVEVNDSGGSGELTPRDWQSQ